MSKLMELPWNVFVLDFWVSFTYLIAVSSSAVLSVVDLGVGGGVGRAPLQPQQTKCIAFD